VFEELAELRPALEIEALESVLRDKAGRQQRRGTKGHWADVWRGNLTEWSGDHSNAANFLCCEVIRSGAGHSDDVVTVWGGSGLVDQDKQEKFKTRPAWVLDTIDKAARLVLVELQDKAAKRGKPAPAIELPTAVVESLEKTGDRVTRTKSGKLEPTEGNVVVVLRNDPRVKGLFGFNELVQRAVRLDSFRVFDRGACDKPGALSDDDVTRVSMWLAIEYGVNMDHKCLMRGIEAAALDAKFDPLADSLLALGKQWDGVARVDSWLKQFALVDDTGCAEYVSMAGRCFLVGAVARALEPGCQLDTVLSIEGAGGGGKSSMFKVLAEAVGKGLFTDGVHDVSVTQSLIEGAEGCWIIELAELAGIRRAADVEALKKSLTQTEDKHRRPYDVLTRVIQRRSVFVATTNRTEGYIADPSGALARRFHPVRTLSTEKNQIDRAALARVAGQLWGEAVRMYQAGVKWHIVEADGKAFSQWVNGRELRNEDGAFHSELFEYLQRWVGDNPAEGRSLTAIAEVVGDRRTVEAGGTGSAAMALAGTLTQLGMVKRKSGTSKWFFSVDACNRFAGEREKALREQAGKDKSPRLRAA
jgi:predicted P-loop ATPase